MADIEVFSKAEFQKIIDETKSSLISLVIDYEATDCFIRNCVYPDLLPDSDEERASFGYALFWMAKRNLAITLLFSSNEIKKLKIRSGSHMIFLRFWSCLQGRLKNSITR